MSPGHPDDFEPGVDAGAQPDERSLVFGFAGDRLLVRAGSEPPALASARDLEGIGGEPIFIGRLGEVPCFTVPLEPEAARDGLAALGLRELFGRLDPHLHRVAGRAFQVAEWFRTHAFCGRCGQPTRPLETERARACDRCGALYFPRISPAVIMLVERDERMLLAHNRRFRGPFYSALAGFVEPGESLEEAVEREVRDEVGIEVGDIRYFGSQPWPFPSQLMIGFFARHVAGEISLADGELDDARWFRRDGRLPELPGGFSIARRLIDAFLAGRAP